MKTIAHNFMRRTLAGLAAGLVLGGMFAATARADMYRLGLNYPPGTAAPYNAGGGIPIQPTTPSITVNPTTVTLSWYGLPCNYGIQALLSGGSWTNFASGLATDYSWSTTALKPDPAGSSFLLALTNHYVGQSDCSSCHLNTYVSWASTHHASALTDLAAIHQNNNASCLPCHTVGYGQPTGYTDSVNTPNLANVGCEDCHGAAGWHKANDHSLIHPAVSIDPAICGSCHQGYNPQYEEYMTSLHSQVNDDVKYGFNSGVFYTNTTSFVIKGVTWTSYGYYQSTNPVTGVVTITNTTGIINSTNVPGSGIDSGDDRQTSCGVCHSGAARMAMIEDYEARQSGITNPLVLPTANDAGAWGPTCGVCHDPHGVRSYPLFSYVTNIVAGVSTNYGMVASGSQTLQLRNPTWSSNYFTMASQSDKRYDSSGKPYYMNTTFSSLYDPNVNVCGQCHNTRGARWDGLAYGLITNTISGNVSNVVYVQQWITNTYTQVFTNTTPWTTNTYSYKQSVGWFPTTNSVTVTNQAVSVGLTTNVTGFSRAPHNSVQYNILIGILQPDYLNTTNGKTVWTNSVLTNGIGIYATHSGIAPRSSYNTNQCATCHVPSYVNASGANVTGHSFNMDINNCIQCHSSVPTWAVTQATTTNSIRNMVILLNQWAMDKAPALFSVADYNKSLLNIWEYTSPGVLASLTNSGPATTNQLKLPTQILQARFNTYMVRNDGSLGVHNPTFIPLLLNWAETNVLSQYPVAGFKGSSVIGDPTAINTIVYTNVTPKITNYVTGLRVVFSTLSTNLTSYNWNFGDGNTSTLPSTTNYYTGVGTYTVTFTGTNSYGVGETLVRSNYITTVNLPTASFTPTSASGTRPFTVNFTSTSTGGLSYRWQIFTNTSSSGYLYMSDTTAPSYTYGTNLAAASLKVILRVSNAAGSSTVTNTVTVH